MVCQVEDGVGDRFAIATPHRAATEAGRAAFQAGGSAVDAALTASCVLSVAYPHMTGVGGDLFALVARPSGEVVAVNGSGAAAAGVVPAEVRRRHGTMPHDGPLAITVPGAVAAWGVLEGLGARRGLAAAIAPAARLAREGVAVAPSLARALAEPGAAVARDPGLAAVFVRDGAPLTAGATLRDPALAATLETIARDGPPAFYQGALGERWIRGLRTQGALLAEADLAAHQTRCSAPLVGRYGETEILTAPPNSQGCLLLAILAVVERLGLARDHLGPDAGRLARLFAAVTAERDRGLCDPAGGPDFAERLLAPAGLDRLAAQVDGSAPPPPGPPPGRHRGDTVAVVAADADGTVVSLNHSLYGGFGSGIREPQTGIIAHNRGASFVLEPGHPNRLAPGRRPAHTLMPVLVRREGRIAVAAGTMGGSAHPQIHASLLLACLDRDLGPGPAVALPRWVVGGLGGEAAPDGAMPVVFAEAGVGAPVVASIERSGFAVQLLGPLDEGVGHAQLIVRDAAGLLRAGSDPRADGGVAVG